MEPKSIGETTNLFEYDNGIILTGKIFGYTNPNKYFPSYLITLFTNEKENYCRFPSGTTYYFTNKNPFEIFKSSKHFIEEKNEKIILPFHIAFAYSKEEIKVDFSKKINEDLIKSLSRNDLSLDAKRIINLYLEGENIF